VNVYVLSEGDLAEEWILGVYSTAELAEEARAKAQGESKNNAWHHWSVEAFVVDPQPVHADLVAT
jgi:hypothetical protein